MEVGLDDETRAEILGGITADDLIITVGQEIVEDGDSLGISVKAETFGD